jgi:hypothetical protein
LELDEFFVGKQDGMSLITKQKKDKIILKELLKVVYECMD